MSAPHPTPMIYQGAGLFQVPRGHLRRTEEQYGAGEYVVMAPQEERSAASHAHYFAVIREAWMSLPEDLAPSFPSQDHLRKACLIRAGYRDERTVVCASKAEAHRVAAFVRPMDDYAIVSVSGTAVVVLTAKSQSMRAMGKTVFGESKEAVLNVLAELLGVQPEQIAQASAA